MTYELAMHSKYLKQQMRMIWRLPWWFYGGTHIEEDEEERSAHAGTYLGMRDER